MAAVVASLGSGPRPVAIDRARIDRQIRDLALEHAAGRLEDAVDLERLHELRDAKENLERTSADGISPERAVAWLRELSATWRAAEVPAEKADLLHAIYDRITVAARGRTRNGYCMMQGDVPNANETYRRYSSHDITSHINVQY